MKSVRWGERKVTGEKDLEKKIVRVFLHFLVLELDNFSLAANACSQFLCLIFTDFQHISIVFLHWPHPCTMWSARMPISLPVHSSLALPVSRHQHAPCSYVHTGSGDVSTIIDKQTAVMF